jgi:carbon storage regulator
VGGGPGERSPGAVTMLAASVCGTRAGRPVGQEEGCSKLLVLTRKSNQSIMIGDDIEISVLSVIGEKVRIGIQAPQEVPVFRKEIYLEIHRDEGEAASQEGVPAEVDDALRKLGEA